MEMKQKELEQRRQGAQEPTPLTPAVDIVEDADGIRVTADMAGVSKDHVSIGVEGDTLTIEGIVGLGENAALQPVYQEVGVAHYRRSFVLSRDLDTERIEAQMRNGVLTLRMPKREQAKPRRIEVRTG
jgi:HSP20 family protein